MKRLITILIVVIAIISASCKNDKKNDDQRADSLYADSLRQDSIKNNSNGVSKEFTSKFICPNHCKGSGSENFGNCPVCGMEYIENLDYNN